MKKSTYTYQQIAQEYEQKIASGEWQPGQRLPTVNDLAESSSYSKVTVNRALRLLADKGVIIMKRGAGISVAERERSRVIGLLIGPSIIEPRQSPFASAIVKSSMMIYRENRQSYRLYIENPALMNEGIPSKELQEDLKNHRLSGLIMAHCNAPKTIPSSKLFLDNPIPLVDISGDEFVDHTVGFKASDQLDQAFATAKEHGCSSMGILSLYSTANPERVKELSGQYGIAVRKRWIIRSTQSGLSHEEAGFINLQGLWNQHPQPEAIFITDDVVAKGATQALLKCCPDPSKLPLVIVISNRNADLFYPVPVIRLEVDTRAMAEAAYNLIKELMDNPNMEPRHIKA